MNCRRAHTDQDRGASRNASQRNRGAHRNGLSRRTPAYWVCPLIDESDLVRYEAAEETAAMLAEALPDVRIGLVHGRMSGRQKDAVMSHFKQASSTCSWRRP